MICAQSVDVVSIDVDNTAFSDSPYNILTFDSSDVFPARVVVKILFHSQGTFLICTSGAFDGGVIQTWSHTPSNSWYKCVFP